jgi:hypothetical protein
MHVYEVQPRKDKRGGVDLISDAKQKPPSGEA